MADINKNLSEGIYILEVKMLDSHSIDNTVYALDITIPPTGLEQENKTDGNAFLGHKHWYCHYFSESSIPIDFDHSTFIREHSDLSEQSIDEIFSQLTDANIRIDEIQGSTDNLREETKAILATLDAIID